MLPVRGFADVGYSARPSSGSYDGAVESVCLSAPQNQNIWRKEGEKKDTKVAVKCYFRDEIVIFRGDGIKYSQARPPHSQLDAFGRGACHTDA
jgi:hypothetical protein